MSGVEVDDRSVPDLVGDLVRAVFALLRSTARMLRFEAGEVARRLARRVALLVASAVIGAAGLVVVLGAVALLVEESFGLPRWVALGSTGAVALVAGGLGVAWAVRRLGHEDLAFPETFAELNRDLEAAADAPRGEGPK